MITVETAQDLGVLRGLVKLVLSVIPATSGMAGLTDELTDERIAGACALLGIRQSVLVLVQPGAKVEAVADFSGRPEAGK